VELLKGFDLVTVRIQGGLGNQLFQLAAGYYVSMQNDQNQMTLDVSRIPFGTDATRRLQLRNFQLLPPEFKVEIIGERIAKFAQHLPRRTASQLIHGYSLISDSIIHRKRNIFVDDKESHSLKSLSSDTTLHGYFNDFDIVSKAEKFGFLRNLELNFEPTQRIRESLRNLDLESSVALHVRLGDYLKYPHIFGNLSENFYLECLKHLEVNTSDQIVIFSDQPNKVANLLPNISGRSKTTIFREPNGTASFETFYVMSQFQRIVCANSTFSMWAAWFNDVNGDSKRVTVPSPYLLNEKDMNTPASWIRIPRIK